MTLVVPVVPWWARLDGWALDQMGQIPVDRGKHDTNAMAAAIVCAAATGVADIARFPKRLKVRVQFFVPANARLPGEDAAQLSRRITAELRHRAPVCSCGRGTA